MATELELQQIANQEIPRRRFGTRVTPQTQRQVIEQRQQAQAQLQQIAQERERQRQEQLRQQQSPNRLNIIQENLNTAIKTKGRFADSYKSLTKEERNLVNQLYENYELSRERSKSIGDKSNAEFIKRQAVAQVEQQLGQSLSPELRKQIEYQALSGATTIQLYNRPLNNQQFTPAPSGQAYTPLYYSPTPRQTNISINTPVGSGSRGGVIVTTQRGTQEVFYSPTPRGTQPQIQSNIYYGSSIQKTDKPSIRQPIEYIDYQISQIRSKGGYLTYATIPLIAGSGILKTGRFALQGITSPKKTVTSFFRQTYTFTSSFLNEGFPQVGEILRTEPEYALSKVTGEILAQKAIAEIQYKVTSRIGSFSGVIARYEPSYAPVKLQGVNVMLDKSILDIGNIIPRKQLNDFELPIEIGKEEVIKLSSREIGLIPEGGKAIQRNIPVSKIKKIENIALKPTLRGAFGYSTSEQSKFIGVQGAVTSQRSLLSFFTKKATLITIEEKYGLFATPAELSGRLNTRASRLGEISAPPSLFQFLTEDLSLTRGRPQILVFSEEVIGKGAFKPFGKIISGRPTSELEVVTLPPTFQNAPIGIKAIKRLGVTSIGEGLGRRVPIYETEFVYREINNLNIKTLSNNKISSYYEQPYKLNIPKLFRQNYGEYSKQVLVKEYNQFKKYNYDKSLYAITKRINYSGKTRSYVSLKSNSVIGYSSNINNNYTTPYYPVITINQKYINRGYQMPIKNILKQKKSFKYESKNKIKDYLNLPSYVTFIKFKGNKIYLGGSSLRTEAILKGIRATTQGRTALSAQFGIERSGNVRVTKVTQQKDLSRLFREYKIRRGKQIKTPDIFIQRRSARLSTLAERVQIQLARRQKL